MKNTYLHTPKKAVNSEYDGESGHVTSTTASDGPDPEYFMLTLLFYTLFPPSPTSRIKNFVSVAPTHSEDAFLAESPVCPLSIFISVAFPSHFPS